MGILVNTRLTKYRRHCFAYCSKELRKFGDLLLIFVVFGNKKSFWFFWLVFVLALALALAQGLWSSSRYCYYQVCRINAAQYHDYSGFASCEVTINAQFLSSCFFNLFI